MVELVHQIETFLAVQDHTLYIIPFYLHCIKTIARLAKHGLEVFILPPSYCPSHTIYIRRTSFSRELVKSLIPTPFFPVTLRLH